MSPAIASGVSESRGAPLTRLFDPDEHRAAYETARKTVRDNQAKAEAADYYRILDENEALAHIPSNITITGTEAEQTAFKRWMVEIARYGPGRQVLRQIAESGRHLTLQLSQESDVKEFGGLTFETAPGTPRNIRNPRSGSGAADATVLLFDRTAMGNYFSAPPDEGSHLLKNVQAQSGATSFITFDAPTNLLHELVHAADIMTGTLPARDKAEARAVSIENEFRRVRHTDLVRRGVMPAGSLPEQRLNHGNASYRQPHEYPDKVLQQKINRRLMPTPRIYLRP
jgi:hypothetical protein